jgi:hypothetical protein
MDSVRIGLTGDRQAGLRFEEFPDELYGELTQTISALGDELLGLIEAATPSRTDELRSKERLRIFTDQKPHHCLCRRLSRRPRGNGQGGRAGIRRA